MSIEQYNEERRRIQIVLNNQIAASEKSATELETKIESPDDQVMVAHKWAMICYEVEDLIVTVLAIYDATNHGTERFQGVFDGEEADQFESCWHDLYKRLNKLFAKLDWLIRAMKNEGHNNLKGSDSVASAWREIRGIVSVDPKRVTAAKNQIAAARREIADYRRERDGK